MNLRRFRIVLILLVIFLSACSLNNDNNEDNSDGNIEDIGWEDSEDVNAVINTSHYYSMPYKYIDPGDTLEFEIFEAQTVSSISVTDIDARDGYDFVVKEKREWDDRIRYLGYSDGNFYLLEVKSKDPNNTDQNISYDKMVDECNLEECPLYLSLNEESYEKVYKIRDCKYHDDIDIYLYSQKLSNSECIKTTIISTPPDEGVDCENRVYTQITVDSTGIYFIYETGYTAMRISNESSFDANEKLYEIYKNKTKRLSQ